jgi:hypothetical protein
MFPEVNLISEDRSLMPARVLSKRTKELIDIVRSRLSAGEDELTYVSLYGALRMHKANFMRFIKKPEWTEWTASAGLRVARRKGGILAICRA